MTHSQYAVVESSTAFKFFPATTNKPIAPKPHTANKTIAHNQFFSGHNSNRISLV